VVTDDVNGFSLTLPDGYVRITDRAQLESLVKAGMAKNPRLKDVLKQYAAMGKSARVFALKHAVEGFADNLNVLAVPAAGLTGERIQDAYMTVKRALEYNLQATIVGHRVEMVAGTRALRVEYRLMIAQRPLHGTQVYLTHGDKLLIVSITQNEVKERTVDANRIIASLRFV